MKISNEFKIGFWALVALLVLFFGIDYLKGINRFRPGKYYYMTCNNVEGLTVSGHVMLNGYKVGLVRSMSYDRKHPGQVLVEINLGDEIDLPNDSYAEVQTDLLGTASVVLHLGTSPTLYANRDTLLGGDKALGIMDRVNPMLPEVAAMLPKLDSILTGMNQIVNHSGLQESFENVNKLTTDLCETTARLNSLLRGDVPQIMAHANSAVTNLDSISTELKEAEISALLANAARALDEARATLAHLNEADNTAGRLLTTPELHDQLVATITDLDSLINDLKANPKRYINVSVFGGKSK
jgi:phospholipid/cholesterol/gamma-HCH transport system substrate-binding protein